MGLFIWDTQPSKIFVGDTPISKVFVWNTQVRPTSPALPYHIPTQTELQNLISLMWTVWISSSQWNLFSEYLRLPYAWFRSNTNVVNNLNSQSGLWSTTPWTYTYNAIYFSVSSNIVTANINGQRARWYYVRCFADTPVTPDGTRTTMYQNGGKWVYWNSWLGIISITDWNTVITIKDKNEWATTVFNYWDTLTIANTWNTYQRWNMYAFPSTKDTTTTITTSSTQVDTTGYGSGTWYSSSTFITWSNDWSNPSNNNLWNWAPAPTSI